MKRFRIASSSVMLAASLVAYPVSQAVAQCSSSAKAASHTDKKDIVDTAVSAGKFNTLVAAVKAAGLVETLKGDGPFTVFAPTDRAFAKLPAGTLDDLVKPENKEKLRAILTYHVVPGKLTASRVVESTGAVTVNGQRINFATEHGKATVDNAAVTATDIMCSNGVIHVIDAVVLPSGDSIVQTATKAKKFNTLLTAAGKAGLAETLANDGPFTVFAPTDEAFAKLPAGTLESLLQPENKHKLAKILKYHVVPGRVYAESAVRAGEAKTLADEHVRIKAYGSEVRVDRARVIATDIDASNGVIHVIDTVILPG